MTIPGCWWTTSASTTTTRPGSWSCSATPSPTGRPVGWTVPEHIGRHAHPKAPPETEPEPITPTGIDYIRLLADADRAETRQRLNLAHLADTAEPADIGDEEADQR